MRVASLVILTALVAVALAIGPHTTFEDAFAREKILPLASASYAPNPQDCLTRTHTGATLVKKVEAPCDFFKNSCVGFIAVSPADQAIIISYRGTKGAGQFLAQITSTLFTFKVNFAAGGKVSKYFNGAFIDLWNGGLKDAFAATAAQNPDYQLWITGFSLGGSVASLTAAHISANGLFPADQIRLVTFGQPRTGDKAYANSFEQHVPHAFRVVQYKDPIPHIPFRWMGGYQHQATEVFYHNDMSSASFKVCSGQEDPTCADKYLLETQLAEHTAYYEKDIDVWGEGGCQ